MGVDINEDEDIRRIMMDDTKDGGLSISTLISTKKGLEIVEIADITEEERKQCELIYKAADTDGNGSIDHREFYDLLKKLFPRISRSESNSLYQLIDIDRSDSISLKEFIYAISRYKWDLKSLSKVTLTSSKSQESTFAYEIPFDEFQIGEYLGHGSFGTVFKAKWRGLFVAVKQLNSNLSEDELVDFRTEIAIMSELRHPNVVLFLGASTTGKKKTIVTELLSCSLSDMIQKKAKIRERDKLKITFQIALGCNYLHLNKPIIVHRDLKPANILLDKNGNAKLIDFGLSSIKKETLYESKTDLGSPYWKAPEMHRKEKYTEKIDVYSFALVVYEIYTGITPFSNMNINSLQDLEHRVGVLGERPSLDPLSHRRSITRLVQRCWNQKPEKRPSFAHIVSYSMFKSVEES